jgi:hypothetical protein
VRWFFEEWQRRGVQRSWGPWIQGGKKSRQRWLWEGGEGRFSKAAKPNTSTM